MSVLGITTFSCDLEGNRDALLGSLEELKDEEKWKDSWTWGRFLSTAPLTKSYPMLTPYQFASNTPIWTIDLDGLEAIVIHGVGADPTRLDHPTIKTLIEDAYFPLAQNNRTDRSFSWKYEDPDKKEGKKLNPAWPSDENLRKAAGLLVTHVLKVRSGEISETELPLSNEEHVTLIAFSGGGPAAILAAKMLKKDYPDLVVNVITQNSPAASEGSEFHPSGGVIDDFVAFTTKGDIVPERWFRGFKKMFKEDTLEEGFQQIEIGANAWFPPLEHDASKTKIEDIKNLNVDIAVPNTTHPPEDD